MKILTYMDISWKLYNFTFSFPFSSFIPFFHGGESVESVDNGQMGLQFVFVLPARVLHILRLK